MMDGDGDDEKKEMKVLFLREFECMGNCES